MNERPTPNEAKARLEAAGLKVHEPTTDRIPPPIDLGVSLSDIICELRGHDHSGDDA